MAPWDEIEQQYACIISVRGSAAYDREFDSRFQEKGSEARRAANKVVHCQSKAKDCPNTKAYKQHKKK